MLMTHVISGFPDSQTSQAIMHTMAESGADIMEVQIPFSDPLADGPTIMAANQQALDGGATPATTFAFLKTMSAQLPLPLLVMSYTNIVFRMGWLNFATACGDAGLTGAILPDLPYDETPAGFDTNMHRMGQHCIRPLSPGMSDQRLAACLKRASGFVYVTLKTGITGVSGHIDPRGLEILARVRAMTQMPIAVGFGISSPEQVAMLRDKADIIIIGSQVIRIFRAEGLEGVARFIRQCRAVLDA
jgi:tryptophan synthase alpha chain